MPSFCFSSLQISSISFNFPWQVGHFSRVYSTLSVISSSNVNIQKNNDDYVLDVTNDDGGNIKLKLNNPLVDKLLFINLEGLLENSCSIDNIEMTINNVSNVLTCRSWIYKNKNNTFHFLINDKYLDTLDISLKKGTYNITNITTYVLDYNVLKELQNNINPLNNISVENDTIKGTINADSDTYLVTSIPYDEGFKIYIDDVLVPSVKVNTAFLGAKLSSGQHEVKIVYHTPWLNIGKILSVMGLVFYLIILYKERKNEKIKRTIS